jgi:hypothetical protein
MTPHRDVPFTKIDQEGKKKVTKVEKNNQESKQEHHRTHTTPLHATRENQSTPQFLVAFHASFPTKSMSILRMALSSKMEAAQSALSAALLTALDVGDDGVVKPSSAEPLSAILPRHTGSSGSICFVVRRPG